jgi:hypothetical protein
MSINKPHKAVINLSMEIHALLDTGECSGQVISAQGLEKFDLKPHFILAVDGYNLEDCINNLKRKIEAFNNG